MASTDIPPLALVLLVWIGAWSLIAAAQMVWDKRLARRAHRRIPERSLLGVAFVGGAPGAWLAMHLVRHKTRHLRFRILLPLAALGWLALVVSSWSLTWP